MKENADKARALDDAEMAKQLHEGAEQMFRLRFQMTMGQMDGLKKYRTLRKERARMLTVINEKKTGHEHKPKAPAAPVAAAETKAAPAAKPKAAAKSATKVAAKPAAKKVAVPKASTKRAAVATPRKSNRGS